MLQFSPPHMHERTTGASKQPAAMRLLLGLLLMVLVQLPIHSLAQSVSLKGNKLTLQQVFAEVKKQTNYAVVYSPEVVDPKTKVTVSASNQPLEAFMKDLLDGLPFSFNIVGSNIVILKKEQLKINAAESASRELMGMVYDEKTSLPIRGVTVTVNGSGQATQSDEKGKFTIKNAASSFSITLTSIGYEKVVRKVLPADINIMVPMTVATNELDQAVVQAYGTTTKRMATGNITKVTGEEIRRQPVMNPLLALQGKVPGMIVTPTGPSAGGAVKVEIRGRNSINSEVLSEPLYVIDGVPQTVLEVSGSTRYGQGVSAGNIQAGVSATRGQSPLFSLNPRDIESIEVLKDGDATAIYGSRAANGVMLITTRKARPGKTSFDFGIRQGMTMVPKPRPMLNTQEYVAMRKEAFRNDGIILNPINAPDLMVWDTTRYTNWYDEMLHSGKVFSVSAGISGGDNKTSFRLSSDYTNQVDLFSRDGHNKRASLLYSMNHRSNDQKFTANFSVNYSYTDVSAVLDRTAGFTTPPNAPPIFDENGNLNYAPWNAINLPTAFPFEYIRQPNYAKTNSLSSSLRFGYELLKGLNIGVSTGYTNMQNKNDMYKPIAGQNPIINPKGQVISGRTTNSNWIVEPEVRYTTVIGKGSLTLLTGGTLQSTTTSATGLIQNGFADDDLIRSALSATSTTPISDGSSQYKYTAVFGRIQFNWDRKYMLTLNGRRDGSSRFARGKQFGNFGSVGAGWILSEEAWISKFLPEWFSFAKLRGSFAVTGNDGVRDYEFYPQWAGRQPGGATTLDYNGIKPFILVVPVNQKFQWETVKKYEGAIQLGFFQERLNVDIAWYLNRSGNQLSSIPTPQFVGHSSVTGNWNAVVDNKGIEATVTATVIRKKDLSLKLNVQAGRNQNILAKYPGIETSPYYSLYKVGNSLATRYVYHYIGVNPLTGLYVLEDYNKDGRVTQSGSTAPGTRDDDRYIGIDMNPAFSGGMGAALSYKNLSVNLDFAFTKTKGEHPFASISPGRMTNLILPKEIMDDHWRKPGDNTKYARYSTSAANTFTQTDRAFIDASYLRLNTVAVSYLLPEKWVKMAAMQSCVFAVNMQNVFTITSYQADPEIQNNTYVPIPRIVTASLSFNF